MLYKYIFIVLGFIPLLLLCNLINRLVFVKLFINFLASIIKHFNTVQCIHSTCILYENTSVIQLNTMAIKKV